MSTPAVMNGMDIAEAAAAIRTLLDNTVASVGISSSEFLALRILAIRGPLSPTDLHDYLATQLLFGLRKENAAGVLAGLEERGLLTGTPIEGTGPGQMTDAGRTVFGEVAAAITAVSERLYVVVDHQDLVTSTQVLARLTERAKELTPA
jgi:DNA-binding MarR family transcriptional regulator